MSNGITHPQKSKWMASSMAAKAEATRRQIEHEQLQAVYDGGYPAIHGVMAKIEMLATNAGVHSASILDEWSEMGPESQRLLMRVLRECAYTMDEDQNGYFTGIVRWP